jgi:uncharacterized membrane protein YeaQ/YmgE (transglycosylase-associated protein family)
MYYFLLIVVGAVVGALARFIGAGKAAPLLGSMLVGLAGSAIGQYFGRLTHFSQGSGSADFVTALVGAIVLVALYHAVTLSRVTR